jgi:hypothetical protein
VQNAGGCSSGGLDPGDSRGGGAGLGLFAVLALGLVRKGGRR